MISLFSIPKPFIGSVSALQVNAINSWRLLPEVNEIFIFGNEYGIAEAAIKLGVNHIPEVLRNQQGTPLLNDAFEKAQELSSSPVIGYLNADIILLPELTQKINSVALQFKEFLSVGQRWNIDMKGHYKFEKGWEKSLRQYVTKYGQLEGISGLDYFFFPRGQFQIIPPFVVGRAGWDNWMIYHARSRNIPVIDMTPVVLAIHQNHDYNHIAGGKQDAYRGQEAEENKKFAPAKTNFSLLDVTRVFTPAGIQSAIEKKYLIQRLNRQFTLSRLANTSNLRHFILRILVKISNILIKFLPVKTISRLIYNFLEWSEVNQKSY
jgi:hypothetical protein